MFDNANDHKLEQIMRIFRELPPDFQEYLLIQVQNLMGNAEVTDCYDLNC